MVQCEVLHNCLQDNAGGNAMHVKDQDSVGRMEHWTREPQNILAVVHGYSAEGRGSPGSVFPQVYVPPGLCSPRSVFPQVCVPPGLGN